MQLHRAVRSLTLCSTLALAAACGGDNLFSSGVVTGPGTGGSFGRDTLDASGTLSADFFEDLAFGNEFGTSTERIRKWAFAPSVELIDATTDDLIAVNTVLNEIRVITGVDGFVVPNNGDIRVFFVPRGDFDDILDVPTGVEGATVGLWNLDFVLTSATVVIDAAATGNRRSHIIREELAQAFGLLRDSWRIPESIFYRGSSLQTEFSDIDRDMLAILYSPLILPGMTIEEVEEVFDGILP